MLLFSRQSRPCVRCDATVSSQCRQYWRRLGWADQPLLAGAELRSCQARPRPGDSPAVVSPPGLAASSPIGGMIVNCSLWFIIGKLNRTESCKSKTYQSLSLALISDVNVNSIAYTYFIHKLIKGILFTKIYKTFVWLSNNRYLDGLSPGVTAVAWWWWCTASPGSAWPRCSARWSWWAGSGTWPCNIPPNSNHLPCLSFVSPVLLWLSDSHRAGDQFRVDDGGEGGGGGEAGPGETRQAGPEELEVALELLRCEAGGGELTKLPQLRQLLQLREGGHCG